MERTRVILVDMPRMLHDIIKEVVSNEPDLEIVDVFEDRETALRAMPRTEPCVVITSPQGPASENVDGFFGGRPRMRLLAVSADGSETTLYELRQQKRDLGEISARMLVAAIRDRLPTIQPSVERVEAEGPREEYR